MSDIIKQESVELQSFGADDYWQDLDRDDFTIPKVYLGQKSSQGNKVPGKFNYNTGGVVEKFEGCHLLVPLKTRVLYKNNKARCKSDNFQVPSPFVNNPISKNCMTCYAAQWGDSDPDKIALAKECNIDKLKAPICRDTYNLLMVDNKFSPFFIGMQSTQLPITRVKLFSRLRNEFMGVRPYYIAFDMSLEKTLDTQSKKEYYQICYDNFREEKDSKRREFLHGLYMEHSNSARDILAQQHEDENNQPLPNAADSISDDDVPF